MQDNPSQKHWWHELTDEELLKLDMKHEDILDTNDEDLNDEDLYDHLFEDVKLEVNEWMTTYGRSHIREWLGDNMQKLLKQDGFSTGGKRKSTQELTPKTSAFKKPRGSKTKDVSEVMEIGE